MTLNKKALGSKIKSIRKKKGITQQTLAEWTDCTPTHISYCETGRKNMSLEWVNIDHWCRGADGTLRHQYLLAVSERDAFSCDYDELAQIKSRLQFSELAETTQEILQNQFHYMGSGFCDSIDAFIWGNLDELERLLDKQVEYPTDFAINRKQLQSAVTIAKEALLRFKQSLPYEEGMQCSKPQDIPTRIILIED